MIKENERNKNWWVWLYMNFNSISWLIMNGVWLQLAEKVTDIAWNCENQTLHRHLCIPWCIVGFLLHNILSSVSTFKFTNEFTFGGVGGHLYLTLNLRGEGLLGMESLSRVQFYLKYCPRFLFFLKDKSVWSILICLSFVVANPFANYSSYKLVTFCV